MSIEKRTIVELIIDVTITILSAIFRSKNRPKPPSDCKEKNK